MTLRVLSIVLGSIIAILGCISHFDSSWVKASFCLPNSVCVPPYKRCSQPEVTKCPRISLERYFISVTIISLGVSVIFYAISRLKDTKYDLCYHIISAILLLVAATVYFVSTEQINVLVNMSVGNKGPDYNFRRPEKLTAASLTLIQVCLHGVISFRIRSSNSQIHYSKVIELQDLD